MPLAGKSVKFRWAADLDSIFAGAVWDIDDVKLYTCDVPPPPVPTQPPANLSATDGEFSTRIVLTWDAVPDADQYLIFRDTDPTGSSMVLHAASAYLTYRD